MLIISIIGNIILLAVALGFLLVLCGGIWFGFLGSHEIRAYQAGTKLKAYNPELYKPKWFNRKGNPRKEYLKGVKEEGLDNANRGLSYRLNHSDMAKVGDKEAINVYQTASDSVKKAKDKANQSLAGLYSQKEAEKLAQETTEAENESRIFNWNPIRPRKTTRKIGENRS